MSGFDLANSAFSSSNAYVTFAAANTLISPAFRLKAAMAANTNEKNVFSFLYSYYDLTCFDYSGEFVAHADTHLHRAFFGDDRG